jgi:hypothetical protein
MTRHTEPTDSQRRPIKIVAHECIAHTQGSVGVHWCSSFTKSLRSTSPLMSLSAQNERSCHQRQCSYSTPLFSHLREAMNHPKGLCQNL